MRLAKAKVHFIGIGGIGMCGLAELLSTMGAQVTGSDLAENAQTQRLQKLGVKIAFEQKPENVKDVEVVVFSSAIKPNNLEFREARRLKIPLIARAEALAELMLLRRGLAVAGSHGKTTTTSMIASIFIEAGAFPTIVAGGRLESIQSTALLGKGEWLIAEADESDGSFLRLSPEISIVTNIDNDHLDHYGTLENLKKAYFDFATRVPFYGMAIACGDDPLIQEVFSDFPKRIMFYGFGPQNDIVLRGENGRYQVYRDNINMGELHLLLPGRHNALNAAAALTAGLEAGISFENCTRALNGFQGVDRRFQRKGSAGGVEIYDDYGHHPTEVQATLQAFREKYPKGRLVVAFQPHRYSRTHFCWDQFLTAFDRVDQLWLCDIYPAGEAPIKNISSERMASEIKSIPVIYLPNSDSRAQKISEQLKPGDIFVTLGAGDIWKLGMQILEQHRK